MSSGERRGRERQGWVPAVCWGEGMLNMPKDAVWGRPSWYRQAVLGMENKCARVCLLSCWCGDVGRGGRPGMGIWGGGEWQLHVDTAKPVGNRGLHLVQNG